MTTPTKTAVIIVAAGSGQRAGGGLPKQWRMLGGQTVADRTIAQFRIHPRIDEIVVVVSAAEIGRSIDGVTKVEGGESRAISVRAGLATLQPSAVDHVLIHDVARPLVSHKIIDNVLDALLHHDGAAPALAVTDALWSGQNDQVNGSVDRTGLYRAQTPQGFRFGAIWAAHQTDNTEAADDVELARAAGIDVAIVPGDENNIKLTWAADFTRAEAILKADMDIRLGNGFDVHRFGDGSFVTLCGVQIPHTRGLQGHSDADVAMHAVTDAIYGALAEGDIGRHFPPSDPQWKGADSAIFLRHAVELARAKGFKISNIDATIICEHPKITPHAPEMTGRMSEIMGMDAGRISIKVTTSERLGFAGRNEGIATIATATLVTA